VETFTLARPLVEDPRYDVRRSRSLDELERMLASNSIDTPIASLIDRMREIPYCFTLQSCSGHFVLGDGKDHHSVKELANANVEKTMVRYRIAYLAFCIQNSAPGRRLLEDLKAITDLDPDFIQFGGAGWFWRDCVNSYVLQVEPARYACEDSAEVGIGEAIRIEEARDRFYARVDDVIDDHVARCSE
jgi:hypothetical protein